MGSPSNRQRRERRCDEKLATAILQYLAEHPQAMDTLEGIAEWWLMRHQVRVRVKAVERVVQQLTERGLLEEIEAGQSRLYKRKAPGGKQ